MNYTEQDIDFLKFTDKQFEELCFDLLMRIGYKGLIWRQGGADSGRDIEGRHTVNSSLVDAYEEKWFFECKRYEKGVPPEELYSKIAWADAEKPKHFVIFVSSYLSNNARTWLEKISRDKPYMIHPIEGKQLKNIILGFPDIINSHFLDECHKLLIDARKSWLIHDIIPGLNTLSYLINNIDKDKLDLRELAFLWCSAKIVTSELDEWPDTTSACEPFNTDSLFEFIASKQNTSDQVISPDDDIAYRTCLGGGNQLASEYHHNTVSQLVLNYSSNPRRALYAFVYNDEKNREWEGVEVLIEATSDFPTKIRYLKNIDIRAEEIDMRKFLWEKSYIDPNNRVE